jgi:coatomer subunit beta
MREAFLVSGPDKILLYLLTILAGEDALANLSIEKTADNSIVGFVRIRSRSQGLALSLGSLKGLKAGTY